LSRIIPEGALNTIYNTVEYKNKKDNEKPENRIGRCR